MLRSIPRLAGTRGATLVIVDDAVLSPTTVPLKGVGVALVPAVCFDHSSVDFGSIVVGFTSTVQTVVITNCGTAALIISNMSLTGADPGDFLTTFSSCTNVTTGSTCVVTLAVCPHQ